MIETRPEVLVVGGDDTQALQLETLLAAAGFEVRLTTDGARALAMARGSRPDVIVGDTVVPGMSGFDLCRSVKEDPALREVPVILLTASTSLHDVVCGLECGADNLIRKPLDARYLISRIHHVLDSRLARNDKGVQVGLRVQLGGGTHFIDAERQQILDLLVSTYEDAIRVTEQLRDQQQRLAGSYQSLEGLYRIAAAIGPALHAPQVTRLALQETLALPGLVAGALLQADSDGAVRVAALSGLAAGAVLCDAGRDCVCRIVAQGAPESHGAVRKGCGLLEQAHAGHDGSIEQIVIPLQVGSRVLGAMALLASGHAGCLREDRQVLRTAARQVAVALERAQLYSDMEALVRERTEALYAERHLMSSIVNTTGALVMLVDADGRIVLFNPACEASLGWREAEVSGRPFWELFADSERAADVKRALQEEGLSMKGGLPGERWRARDGSERRIIWTVSSIRNADRERAYWLGTGLDVTETEGMRERLRYLSNFDTLTGLPNRGLLREKINHALSMAGAGVTGLLWVHCERLPLVRESLGLAAEQALLSGMAARLKRWQRDDDCVARCDEAGFAVLVVRTDLREIKSLATEILTLLDPPFEADGEECHPGASVGIAVAPGDGADVDELMQAAAVAARQARAQPDSRYAFHRPELFRAASERFKLEGALRHALERDELLLQYQPQVSLMTGQIVGFEALVRWRHPVLGIVPPSRFIGIAEDTGLILPIGDWVLRSACEQLRSWRKAGLSLVPVAVNLSAKQFSGQIVDTVRTVLNDTGVDPALLEIELTENVSMDDPESTFQILAALRAVGVQLAIDDFGTGYSNLNYLKRFPVQKLKLDQSFVRELTSSPDDLAISRAVIAMAHNLRLRVIAEGVETDGQLALLHRNGCDEIQGYLFSRPLDPAAATQMLRNRVMLDPARLYRRPAQNGILFLGTNEANLAALKMACAGRAELHVATTREQAFELLAATEIALVCVDAGEDRERSIAFLRVAHQLYLDVPKLLLLPAGRDTDVVCADADDPAYRTVTVPSGRAASIAALRNAVIKTGAKADLRHHRHGAQDDPADLETACRN